MKKFTVAFLMAFLLLTACNQQDLITSPDNSAQISSDKLTLVKLPVRDKNAMQKTITTGDYISNSEGGTLTISDQYTSADGRTVTMFAEIVFPAGYSPTNTNEFITMTVDDETASIEFSPAMTFVNKPVLDVVFTGLAVNNNQYYDFRYVAPSGATELVNYSDLDVDQVPGKLEVIQAVIPHFSRYGYLN